MELKENANNINLKEDWIFITLIIINTEQLSTEKQELEMFLLLLCPYMGTFKNQSA